MIRKDIKKICKTPELIYNYDKAIASPEMCICHHRRELEFTIDELKARGEYENRPPEELIFLTHSAHEWLHNNVCKGWEEKLDRRSERMKGENNPMFGKPLLFSDETKEKLRKSRKGKTPFYGKNHSLEVKEKLSNLMKTKRWWNNGVTCTRAKDCPGPDYFPGRLK